MKLLKIIYESDVVEGAANQDSSKYYQRTAARAIVLDNKNRVALMYAHSNDYYKLPGGGVEAGEDTIQALKRELIEEIGCQVEILDKVGITVEYRDQHKMTQTSYCYLARQIGDKMPSSFTVSEIAEGFQAVWVKNIDKAIELVARCKTSSYGGQFMVKRELILLNAAKKLLDNQKK